MFYPKVFENNKLQINSNQNKKGIQNTETLKPDYGFLLFDFCDLFVIWVLDLGISPLQAGALALFCGTAAEIMAR